MLTGALKDNKRATVVGEQTFGKGIIQTIVPLSDGSAVAVTVAAYQTPNQVSINKVSHSFSYPFLGTFRWGMSAVGMDGISKSPQVFDLPTPVQYIGHAV